MPSAYRLGPVPRGLVQGAQTGDGVWQEFTPQDQRGCPTYPLIQLFFSTALDSGSLPNGFTDLTI